MSISPPFEHLAQKAEITLHFEQEYPTVSDDDVGKMQDAMTRSSNSPVQRAVGKFGSILKTEKTAQHLSLLLKMPE